MPYSLSHAIVSLPISRASCNRIPPESLIIGSISPDFPYLIALTPVNAPGHSLLGVWIYCFLPSLFVLLIWYAWLEKPSFTLFRMPYYSKNIGKQPYFHIAIGILIGAYSHVLWDAASHIDGAFVAHSRFWQQRIFSLPLYKWNQYVSGILGLIGLAMWYAWTVFKYRHNTYKSLPFIGTSIYTSTILLFIIAANLIHQSTSLNNYIIHSAIGTMTGSAVATCIYALIINLKKFGEDE